MSAALTCREVSMTYGTGELSEVVLAGVALEVCAGEACVLLGPSGSGKTTLLSILGCLLTPSGGELSLDGVRVPFGEAERLGVLRREKLGFVFQHAQLLPFLSAEQNVALVGENAGLSRVAATARAVELLAHLGMEASRKKEAHAVQPGHAGRFVGREPAQLIQLGGEGHAGIALEFPAGHVQGVRQAVRILDGEGLAHAKSLASRQGQRQARRAHPFTRMGGQASGTMMCCKRPKMNEALVDVVG